MVFIGAAQQSRLIGIADHHLGDDGEAILRAAAQELYGVPLDQIGYLQVPPMLKRIEEQAAPRVGRASAAALAQALTVLGQDAANGFRDRLIESVSRRLGPAAEPFLTNTCSRLDLRFSTLERGDLPALAEGVRRDASLLLGDEAGQALAAAVLESTAAHPAGLAPSVIALAVDHLGPDGEALARGLCRTRLEAELEDLDGDGVATLAGMVESDLPGPAGAARLAAFTAEARQALVSNAEPLRAKIVQLATRAVGPAGPDLVRDACIGHGMPFESVDYEHLMWLTEALRAEATAIVGKRTADELARDVRGLLIGKN